MQNSAVATDGAKQHTSGKNAKSANVEQPVLYSNIMDADAAAAPATAENISEQPRPRGQLDVKHHGLRKFKKVRKFRCKLCDTVYMTRKVVNDHHKQNHDKCICNTCGKKCTPSTLACHKYSHQEEKKHVCRNCGKKFAFSGQLKQHRFIHRRISHFGCDKCSK